MKTDGTNKTARKEKKERDSSKCIVLLSRVAEKWTASAFVRKWEIWIIPLNWLFSPLTEAGFFGNMYYYCFCGFALVIHWLIGCGFRDKQINCSCCFHEISDLFISLIQIEYTRNASNSRFTTWLTVIQYNVDYRSILVTSLYRKILENSNFIL